MLAKRYKVTLDAIIEANPDVDCYMLRIGMKLCIPGTPTEMEPPAHQCEGILHTVIRGDTLYGLSKQYKVSLDDIMRVNPNLDPYNLRIGMKICIPRNDDRIPEPNPISNSVNNKSYKTQKGDTLSRVLDRFQISYGALSASNPEVNFKDSLEKLTLMIPSKDEFRSCPAAKAYIVKNDDNINSIAKKLLTVPDNLLMANPTLAVEDFSIPGIKVCTPS